MDVLGFAKIGEFAKFAKLCPLQTFVTSTVATYMLFIHYTACPIKGQVRMACASDPICHRACNSTGNLPCPLICIYDGCECPAGTVIDWSKNECVDPRQCEGTNMNNALYTSIIRILSLIVRFLHLLLKNMVIVYTNVT